MFLFEYLVVIISSFNLVFKLNNGSFLWKYLRVEHMFFSERSFNSTEPSSYCKKQFKNWNVILGKNRKWWLKLFLNNFSKNSERCSFIQSVKVSRKQINFINLLMNSVLIMVANPDLRSGFETDLNPDLTKNLDPDWNPDFGFQIRISDFRSGFNPDFGFQIRI